jgi:hypothetical protein
MSSPVIRRYPHRGFSRASRRTSSRTSRLTRGRPGRRPGYVQRRATSRRCHTSSVSGVTNNERHRSRGSRRLAAAKKARSAGRSAGRDICRRKTAISWRRTTISSSLYSEERKHSNTSAVKPQHHIEQRCQHRPPPPGGQSQRHYGSISPKTPAPTSTIEFMHPTARATSFSPHSRAARYRLLLEPVGFTNSRPLKLPTCTGG